VRHGRGSTLDCSAALTAACSSTMNERVAVASPSPSPRQESARTFGVNKHHTGVASIESVLFQKSDIWSL